MYNYYITYASRFFTPEVRIAHLYCSPRLLSGAVAKEAARAWQAVLKEAARLSSGAWYLHMAAGESRLGVHCGQPTGVDPSDPTQGERALIKNTLATLQCGYAYNGGGTGFWLEGVGWCFSF